MKDRARWQRAVDAASGLRKLSAGEEARVRAVVLPYVLVSLVLQGLSLVVGVRTVREMYRARHLGLRLQLGLARGPLLGLLVLNLAQIVTDRRLRRWIRRMIDNPPS